MTVRVTDNLFPMLARWEKTFILPSPLGKVPPRLLLPLFIDAFTEQRAIIYALELQEILEEV